MPTSTLSIAIDWQLVQNFRESWCALELELHSVSIVCACECTCTVHCLISGFGCIIRVVCRTLTATLVLFLRWIDRIQLNVYDKMLVLRWFSSCPISANMQNEKCPTERPPLPCRCDRFVSVFPIIFFFLFSSFRSHIPLISLALTHSDQCECNNRRSSFSPLVVCILWT